MRRFDYSFLETNIPANIVSLSTIIADLRAKGDFRKLQYADSYEKLRKKAIVESVKGSNAIEGIVTTDDRIRDIVNGAIPVTHDEKEISGYKEGKSGISKVSGVYIISGEGMEKEVKKRKRATKK